MNNPILIVPVGEVFNQLNTKMKNGQVSGYSSIWQVYSDGIHMTGIGAYITAVTLLFYIIQSRSAWIGRTVRIWNYKYRSWHYYSKHSLGSCF